MYYVIFFDESHSIKQAHKADKYPKVKDIVYLLKNLEQSDLKDVENLSMDIITSDDFDKL